MDRPPKHLTLSVTVLAMLLAYGCSRPAPPVPPPAQPEAKSLADLRGDVDQLLSSRDPVRIRRGIADVFALVDRLIETGRKDDAERYLAAGLTHNAWALDYQLLYAEMLAARGDEAAGDKARLVLEYAEKDEQINRARRLLGLAPLAPVPEIGPIPEGGTALVLVPVGRVDVCLLDELRQALADKVGIDVYVRDARVAVPPFRRDPYREYVDALRDGLRKGMSEDARLATFMKRNGIGSEDLDQEDVVIDACRRLSLDSGGTNGLARFDAVLAGVRKAERQRDIDELLTAVQTAVRPYLRDNVFFMGVADLDAFSGESNFIFGTARHPGHYAAITYRRFSADFQQENPDRRRLVERSLKQALSSLGFMLGVPRCSTPTCARAYPHSLAEHDAKSTELCEACRAGFDRALGRE